MKQMSEGPGVVRYAGLFDEGGKLVASLKRYHLELTDGNARYDTVGLGAIFTPERMRKRGLAAQLIEATLAEATVDGSVAALLFSDIAPSYYEQFGFELQPAALWSAKPSALPTCAPLHTEALEDDELLLQIYADSWSAEPSRLRVWRRPISYFHAQLRHGAHRSLLLRNDSETAGYVLLSRDGETLWLTDLALCRETAPATLLATLRQLAERAGSNRIAGWLRGAYATPPFVATVRSRCMPMLAWLGATRPRSPMNHFSWLDHF